MPRDHDRPVRLSSPAGIWPGPNYHHLAEANGFLFLAGQVARGPDGAWVGVGDAGSQAAQIWRNIGAILASVDAGPEHIVKITTILVERADNPAVTAQRLAFLGDCRPPHTGMIVKGLGSPEVLVEVEVVAVRPG